jgi:outer membrane biosynthesis protein TonB
MSAPGQQEMSLRPGRFEYKRLVWALAISLAAHLFFYGGYEFTRKVLPVWLERIKFLAALAHALEEKKKAPPPPQPTEAPLIFVEVNPAVATPEPPKDAKYYSSRNSKAGNPEVGDTDTPKISGQQEHVPKTEDAPKVFAPLREIPAPAKPEQEEQKAEVAKPKAPVGDLAMAKPEPTLRPDTGVAEQTRPRTIVEAKTRQQQSNPIPGQKMKQDGGVRERTASPSLDTKSTLTGAYDTAFIAAVTQRWFDLLDSQQFAMNRTGRVVLQFRLNYDGRISNMEIAESSVGETLAYVCQLAVTDPAPYLKFPSDMRRELGDFRDITFTFYY